MAKVPLPAAVGGGDDSSPTVAAGGMPVDPDSDSDKEHPLHEPQFVSHAVDDERCRQRPALLPIHHRPQPAAADDDREERLRVFMIMPQAFLCSCTLIFGVLMIYLANNPEARARPDFDVDWDVLVTASSALVMLFSLVSLLLSHLGVYYYDGWPGLNQWLR